MLPSVLKWLLLLLLQYLLVKCYCIAIAFTAQLYVHVTIDPQWSKDITNLKFPPHIKVPENLQPKLTHWLSSYDMTMKRSPPIHLLHRQIRSAAALQSIWWLGGVVVMALDSQSAGRGFDSRPLHCRATTLGKLFTLHTNVPLFTKQYNLVPCEGFHVNAPVCGSHSWVQWTSGVL